MAERRNRTVSSRYPVTKSGAYIYGNTVRQAEVMPKRRTQEEMPARPKKKVSRQVKQNRKKALKMNPAYVTFLAIAAVCALFVCVKYLQVRSELTSRSENITALQKELSQLKEDNTTRYNAVVDSVNLETVRDRAINSLGMVYANPDQIVTYQNPVDDYVKQYENIPDSGVIAQSDKVSK